MPNRQQILQFLATLFNGAVLGAVLWILLGHLGIADIIGYRGVDPFIAAAAIGAIIAVVKLRKLLWAGLVISVVLIVLISYTPVMRPAVHSVVRQDSVKGSYDAVVALSAGANADGFLNDQGTDRMLTALALIKHGVSNNLVITRFRSDFGNIVITPERDQNWLIALVADSGSKPHVFTAKDVVNTHDEALRTKELAKAQNWKRIVVVTSPVHTRRACATFEKAGMEITCVPSRSTNPPIKSLNAPGDRLTAFRLWLYERIGYLEYWRRGWV